MKGFTAETRKELEALMLSHQIGSQPWVALATLLTLQDIDYKLWKADKRAGDIRG